MHIYLIQNTTAFINDYGCNPHCHLNEFTTRWIKYLSKFPISWKFRGILGGEGWKRVYIYFELYFSAIFLSNYCEQISYKSVHAYCIEEDKFSMKIFHESDKCQNFLKIVKIPIFWWNPEMGQQYWTFPRKSWILIINRPSFTLIF